MNKKIGNRISDYKKIILERVIKNPKSGCWEWQYFKNEHGYGKVSWSRFDTTYVHRISYTIFVKKISKDTFVLHKCDNPGCVNPKHLFIGTQADNMQDMARKGRHVKLDQNGEDGPRAMLTWDKVRFIRDAKVGLMDSLAKKFNVCHGTIYSIWARKKAWIEQ